MHGIDLHQLIAFQRIAREGSVTRAAAQLHISQPALSIKIRALERQIGRQLFVRKGHGVQLSEAGQMLLVHTDNVLRLLGDGIEATRKLGSAASTLSMGCTPSISLSCLSDILARFSESHPHASVTIQSANSAAVFELLLSRIVQVAIIVSNFTAKGIERIPLGQDPICLVAAPDHPLARLVEVDLDEISKYQLILSNVGTGYATLMEAIENKSLSSVLTRIQVDPTHAALRMVERGLGVSFLPHLVIHESLQNGTIVAVRVPELSPISREVAIVLNPQSRNELVDSIIDTAKDVCGKILGAG